MDFQGAGNPLRIDTSNQGGWARLYLYAPQQYGTQVLRPYVYGFDESVAGFLMDKGNESLSGALKRKDVVNTDTVAQIIRPDPVGTEIDMTGFSNMWSFVLILHIPNNVSSGILAAEGSKLLVFRGHCGDEPIDPSSAWMSSPIINRNCGLIVHSREIIRDNPKFISAFGMQGSMDVVGTTDVIDGSLNNCTRDHDLFMLTPSDVLGNYSYRGIDIASAPGLSSISNARTPISTNLKDPGLHLRQILQGIDASNEELQTMEFAPHGIDSFSGALSAATDVAQYKENVVNQLTAMNGPDTEQGIEIKGVVTIGDVERAYPNMTVIPSQIDNPTMMDIIPQDAPSKRTAYSSMAASAISSIAAGCGLGSIAFMFQSYDPARRGELDPSSHQVVPDYTTLTCPPSDPAMYSQTLRAAVELFMMKIKNDLVPFIKYICGEFAIQAYYAFDRETMVDLQFLDDSASTNGGGWFQTPSRLSSLSTTSVGTKANFENNGKSLNSFVMQIQGKTQKGALGLAAFERPLDFGAPVHNETAGLFSTTP